MGLLVFNDKGIYCAQAGVYIDPWRPVKKALITHGHADHSRSGHEDYLCSREAAPAIRHRIPKARIQPIEFGAQIVENGVRFSFHPAGHILGSAQIRVEYKGEVWVVSGDYKLEDDGISGAYEMVPCEHFITESTFGLPVYDWEEQEAVYQQIRSWWHSNAAEGRTSVICAYSLGKAQRLLHGISEGPGLFLTHGAVEALNEVYRQQGISLPESIPAARVKDKETLGRALVICPPAAVGTPWFKRFVRPVVAMASGWMSIRGQKKRGGMDRGFVISDHADWKGLNQAVEASGADHVYVTHGFTDVFARYLREEKGLNAQTVRTLFEGETE